MDDKSPLVNDALEPVQYRVYADTPLDEVIDLIVRRGVRAIPVVGEQYEVLGIITSGDALGQILRSSPAEQPEAATSPQPLVARDVMTRAVLCVSEDQPLNEAAHMMVNRDVEQLPVVRDGELIGFVTRDSILRSLHGGATPQETDNEDDS